MSIVHFPSPLNTHVHRIRKIKELIILLRAFLLCLKLLDNVKKRWKGHVVRRRYAVLLRRELHTCV